MQQTTVFDRVLNTALVLCAVTVTGLYARRTLVPTVPRPSPLAEPHELSPELWREIASSGTRFGEESGRLQIVEFSDFQCPACRAFATGTLKELLANHPREISITYRHWPLPQHSHAYLAARASLCASKQDRFKELHDILFEWQDSIGILPFHEFARHAGVSDSAAFEECLGEAGAHPAIERDVALVNQIKGMGTPTVIVNGTLFTSPPTARTLDSLLLVAKARSPRDG